MSTTQVVSDAWIGATIKGVAGLKGISMKRLSLALGLNPSTLSNKVHGRSPWTAVELATAADTLNVDVGKLLDGYDGAVPFPSRVTETDTKPVTRQYSDPKPVTVIPLPRVA